MGGIGDWRSRPGGIVNREGAKDTKKYLAFLMTCVVGLLVAKSLFIFAISLINGEFFSRARSTPHSRGKGHVSKQTAVLKLHRKGIETG